MSATGFEASPGRFRLTTLRSNDQFNTTIYGFHDRFRGIKGTRQIVFMNEDDMSAYDLSDGDTIALTSDDSDGIGRMVSGLRVVPYNIPRGCIAAYFPECNELISLDHHAEQSHVPAAKSVPVRIVRATAKAAPYGSK